MEARGLLEVQSQVYVMHTKCPHLRLINANCAFTHASCYKTIITSPGKLMERQIKN